MRLNVENVSVSFGGRSVLRQVAFHAEHGDSLAVMGPSGSGKSTLLSVISGRLAPDAGRVSSPASKHETQWILQNAPALTHRTALANVTLGALSAGDSPLRAQARARLVMDRLGVAGLATTPVRRLSGGERQRVAICRAIVGRPRLLLVDEPTAALDHTSRRLVVSALQRVTLTGAITIVVTHDPEVAATCSRVMYLTDGKLRAHSL